MTDAFHWGPANPHPLSKMRTELVWEGKYDEYGKRREVDVAALSMPMQRIETVDEPRQRAEAQGQLAMFEKGLAGQKQDDFRNRLIWGDNKLVTASLLKDFKGKVDLIYIDPPFDVGADFTMDVPIGDEKETVEKDQSTLEMVAYRDMWGKGTDSYLHMMFERLCIMRELLAETGVLYLHIGPNVNHLMRALLDAVFGSENHRNEIIWQRTFAHSDANRFGIVHDHILFYSKSANFSFNKQVRPHAESYIKSHYGQADDAGRPFRLVTLSAAGPGPARWFGNRSIEPPPGRHWAWSQERINASLASGRLVFAKTGQPNIKQYLDETDGTVVQSMWADVPPVNPISAELLGYSTQKPEALLERIVRASSNEGDLVADFFSGSGTTGAVAERLGRRWLLSDLGRYSIHTTRKRLIGVQRSLHADGKPYRAFDVYNLGRYERQWWQQDRLKGADEGHRRVVLEFFKAEVLTHAPSPLLHGRKSGAFCHVDGIDGLFTREEARAVAQAVAGAGGREVYCLAWEFEMELRRMTQPGQATEVVTVIEHEAFARLYQEELAQEGLDIQVVDVDRVPATTVSIFPDRERKDVAALAIEIPALTAANTILPALGPVTEAEVRRAFSRYQPLPIGERGPEEIQYEGRHLITGELVEQMKVNLTLLESGIGAISFFEREIESICKVRNTHQVLGPLLQWFFEEVLFGPGRSIFDSNLVKRLSDSDVREHVRATFVPIVLSKTLRQQVRAALGQSAALANWKPFQVTSSERRPVEQSSRTLFNLVPCDRQLEVAFVEFCTRAPKSDVAAFAKNAGPQALRIDYLNAGGRLAFYTPDFFVRTPTGDHYLVETKGQHDADTSAKARAAVEWCKAASTANGKWTYLFIPEAVFQRFTGETVEQLEATCRQSLVDLIDPHRFAVELPLFATVGTAIMEERPQEQTIVDAKLLDGLPPRARKSAEDAIALYQFLEKKPEPNFAPVFTPFLGVLDEFARAIVIQRLAPRVPAARDAQLDWFTPHYGNIDSRQRDRYNQLANNLRRTVVDNAGISPIGLLRNVLDYSLNDNARIAGVFDAVRVEFRFQGGRDLLAQVTALNDARNTKVAHQFDALTADQALAMLKEWLKALAALWSHAQPRTAAAP